MVKRIGKILLVVVVLLALYEYACYIYTQPFMDEVESTINGPAITQQDRSKLPKMQRLFAPIDDGKTVRHVKSVKRTIVICSFDRASVAIIEHYSFDGNDLYDYMELRIKKVDGEWVISQIIYKP